MTSQRMIKLNRSWVISDAFRRFFLYISTSIDFPSKNKTLRKKRQNSKNLEVLRRVPAQFEPERGDFPRPKKSFQMGGDNDKSSSSLTGNSASDTELAKLSKAKETVDKVASKIRAPGSSPLNANIDFTVHTLETGEKVHTTERICKGMHAMRFQKLIYARVESEGPATFIPTDEQFFSKKDPSKPDLDFLRNHFLREGRLSQEQALYIIKKATAILKAEETLLELESPLTGKIC